MTGFSPLVRDTITTRAEGRCEICRWQATGLEIHHRRPRGMGSTRRPESNQPANGLLVCRACHNHIESYRDMALRAGWLVRQNETPAEVPVLRGREWCLLTDEGTVI